MANPVCFRSFTETPDSLVLSFFQQTKMSTTSAPQGMVVVTNNIPVNKAFEKEFEDRFSKRVHLVDKAPGFIRNEVHRPKQMKFDHKTGRWELDTEKQAYYQIKTWWRSFEDFVAWTNSEAFAIAHNQRAPKDMFAGASHLDVHEIFLSTDLEPHKPSSSAPASAQPSSPRHTTQQSEQSGHQHAHAAQAPPRPPVQDAAHLPTMSMTELSQYNKPPKIFVGLLGKVYDVSQAPQLYGPGKTYHVFAGRDATRAFAKVSLEECDIARRDLGELTSEELRILANWVDKYNDSYTVVARLEPPRDPHAAKL